MNFGGYNDDSVDYSDQSPGLRFAQDLNMAGINLVDASKGYGFTTADEFRTI